MSAARAGRSKSTKSTVAVRGLFGPELVPAARAPAAAPLPPEPDPEPLPPAPAPSPDALAHADPPEVAARVRAVVAWASRNGLSELGAHATAETSARIAEVLARPDSQPFLTCLACHGALAVGAERRDGLHARCGAEERRLEREALLQADAERRAETYLDAMDRAESLEAEEDEGDGEPEAPLGRVIESKRQALWAYTDADGVRRYRPLRPAWRPAGEFTDEERRAQERRLAGFVAAMRRHAGERVPTPVEELRARVGELEKLAAAARGGREREDLQDAAAELLRRLLEAARRQLGDDGPDPEDLERVPELVGRVCAVDRRMMR